jgi:CBS domain containing-hemolysin-like protein
MKQSYHALFSLAMKPHTSFARPKPPPRVVHLDDPAVSVMTDFREVTVLSIGPSETIHFALEKMRYVGVRLLLVVNEECDVIGLITTNDIQTEKPVRVAEDRGISHSEITVEMVMTPQERITVLDMLTVEKAEVGHIIATLRKLERQHGLVVDVDEMTGEQEIRGMFSATQIAKQLGHTVESNVPAAHSLAELIQLSA